jgi:GNAT superfamily N-acetyltransferase
MKIIELKGKQAFAAAYPLVKQQNAQLTRRDFDRYLDAMLTQGYRCIAAVEGDKTVGICGFWQGTRFWCGHFIDLDNVIVDEKARSKGIGKKMTDWVEKEARRLSCDQLGLDCYVTSGAAHRFYFREAYTIKGFHMIKRL